MSSYPRDEAARQRQNNQKHFDYMNGLAGGGANSSAGRAGMREYEATHRKYTPPVGSAPIGPGPDAFPQRPSKPFMPGVDAWVKSIPTSVHWTLAVIGAICGFGYGASTATTADAAVYALLGGFVGLGTITILAKLFKLVVVLVGIALVAAVLYAVFHAMNT